MEPITWSWVFLAVLGGIVGNRADWAVSKAFERSIRKSFENNGNDFLNGLNSRWVSPSCINWRAADAI